MLVRRADLPSHGVPDPTGRRFLSPARRPYYSLRCRYGRQRRGLTPHAGLSLAAGIAPSWRGGTRWRIDPRAALALQATPVERNSRRLSRLLAPYVRPLPRAARDSPSRCR